MASRPPIRTGKALKRRGRLEELTGSLGREVEAPVEEIGAARRSSGGSSGVVALCTRERKEKWCGVKRRSCCPFIGRRGKGRRRARWCAARLVALAPLMARAAAWCTAVSGERKG
jgi:hypothetical protein